MRRLTSGSGFVHRKMAFRRWNLLPSNTFGKKILGKKIDEPLQKKIVRLVSSVVNVNINRSMPAFKFGDLGLRSCDVH